MKHCAFWDITCWNAFQSAPTPTADIVTINPETGEPIVTSAENTDTLVDKTLDTLGLPPDSTSDNSEFHPPDTKLVLKYPTDLGEITQLNDTDALDFYDEQYEFGIDYDSAYSIKSPVGGANSKPFITFNFMEISIKSEDMSRSSTSGKISDAALKFGAGQAVGHIAQTGSSIISTAASGMKGKSAAVAKALGTGLNVLGGVAKVAGAITAATELIGAWDTAKANLNLEGNPNRTTRQMVALYMPPGIAIEDSATYEDNSRAVIAAAAQGMADKDGITNEDLTVVKASMFGQALMGGGLLAAAGGQMGIPGAGVMGALGEFIHLTGDEDMRILGRALNPNQYKQFKNTNLRTFGMNFKFLPDSPSESIEVEEIIKHFRAALYPTKNSAITLVVPDMLSIEFHNANGMVKMPHSYLSSVSVTYNPNSASYFKIDGKPVEITMAIQLQEIMPIHRNDVLEGGM